LVTAQPALMANDGGSVHNGTSKVQVNISLEGNHILLVLSLDLATLVTALGAKGGVKDQLGSSQTFSFISLLKADKSDRQIRPISASLLFWPGFILSMLALRIGYVV